MTFYFSDPRIYEAKQNDLTCQV